MTRPTDAQVDDLHAVSLDIMPPLPAGKALVLIVLDGECLHRVVDRETARLLEPVLTEKVATNVR